MGPVAVLALNGCVGQTDVKVDVSAASSNVVEGGFIKKVTSWNNEEVSPRSVSIQREDEHELRRTWPGHLFDG